MNILFDSVPPDVNITWDAWTSKSDATCSLATLTASRDLVPKSWRLDALPNSPFKNGIIASSTGSAICVVEL